MQADPKVKLARGVMPVVNEWAYLDTASVGAVSEIYADALSRCTDEDLKSGRARAVRFERIDRARERIRSEVAAVLSVGPDEVELTRSTTAAVQTLLERIPWEPGDEIVTTQFEFPTCANAVNEAAAIGSATVRIAQVPDSNADELGWLEQHLTPRTRLIFFSGVAYGTGRMLPISRIAELAIERGVRTLVDGAQLVGASALDLDRTRIDFLAMPLQKWLCGPEGLGALYVRRGTLAPCHDERVTHGWPVLEATATHLEWLREHLGWSWILERTQQLARYARRALGSADAARLLTPEKHAGLVSVRCNRDDLERTADRLASHHIVARIRPELELLRISTAFFNAEDEIDRFVAAIR